MVLSDSTKRSLRTLVQAVLAVATAVPDVVNHVPSGVMGTQVIVVAAGVAKTWAFLEERSLIPSWLRDTPTPPPSA